MDKDKVSLNEIVEKLVEKDRDTTWKYLGIEKKVKVKCSKECGEERFYITPLHYEDTTLYDFLSRILLNTFDSSEKKYGIDNLRKVLISISTYKHEEYKQYDVFEIKCGGILKDIKLNEEFFLSKRFEEQRDRIGPLEFKRILESFNGYHELEYKINEGTAFKIYFNPTS